MTDRLLKNASSGFLVFLIALPLCLGISVASGFPPVAGVLTAIIGGVLASHLGSAPLTIKGPAAGLIVIVLGAVTELGAGDPLLGYKRALAVGVVAGALQILFALLRVGRFSSIMPPSVVHGMLAAIGVIIIAKQTPVMLGVQGASGSPLHMLSHIPSYFMEANPLVLLIGALALVILIALPRIPLKPLKKIPAPMLVLLMTIPLGVALDLAHDHTYSLMGHTYEVGPAYLVTLPGNLMDAITFPDFSVITSGASIKYIAMFALVGSIESLLSVLAVDSLDPAHRVSNVNRDLFVTGLGNLAAAAIGGLPMISEIVRSKANIDAGATDQWSNFFHGLFLLLLVALAPGLLHFIPLAALAAMLVVTGFRLSSPSAFNHALHIGRDQFALFFTTFAVTLITDLLVGVGVGIALKLVLHFARGGTLSTLFGARFSVHKDGDLATVQFSGPLVFTNLLRLQRSLSELANSGAREIVLDFSKATLIDHTSQERLHSLAAEWPNTALRLQGLERLKAASKHPTAFRRAIQES